jgi:hypothetical protein
MVVFNVGRNDCISVIHSYRHSSTDLSYRYIHDQSHPVIVDYDSSHTLLLPHHHFVTAFSK